MSYSLFYISRLHTPDLQSEICIHPLNISPSINRRSTCINSDIGPLSLDSYKSYIRCRSVSRYGKLAVGCHVEDVSGSGQRHESLPILRFPYVYHIVCFQRHDSFSVIEYEDFSDMAFMLLKNRNEFRITAILSLTLETGRETTITFI